MVGARIIFLRHEDFRQTVQVAIIRRVCVHKYLRGNDAMFLQHRYEHLRVDDRASVEQFHGGNYPRKPQF